LELSHVVQLVKAGIVHDLASKYGHSFLGVSRIGNKVKQTENVSIRPEAHLQGNVFNILHLSATVCSGVLGMS
jgi:hypothetical protein